ncbi:MAG: 16S rRNA processing protein RimM [Prevotella sp.]|nr:16S rRNA processing protein RimM [Prevotella sp.]
MIKEEEVYRIGRLGKPHGVKGEVTMQVDDDVFDRVDADFLVLRVGGILVPFYMEEYRFRTDATALIKFEDVDTVEQARQLTNCDVFFLRRLADNDESEYTWTFFVGFDLIEASSGKTVGRIAAVDDSTQNILFELEDGTLIPAAEELIDQIDQEKKQIHMALPEGLLNL